MRRVNLFLINQYRQIVSYTSLITVICGLSLLTPLLVLPFWTHEIKYAPDFIIPALVLIVAGMITRWSTRTKKLEPLDFDQSGIVVMLTWMIMSVFGGIPFMTIMGMDFTQAVFDSVSGWTTTGLSVMDVEHAPHIILIWRAIQQLLGGAGLAIVMIASLTGINANGLYSAEGKGGLMKPHVIDSARMVMSLYIGYAIVGIIAYVIAGMTVFDAIVHCFAAISTGGFSNYMTSIGHYDSANIEAITIVLMIVGNMNFVTVYYLVQGKLKQIFKNGEVKVMLYTLPLGALTVFLTSAQYIYPTMSKAIRVAIFETVSALTTTGFYTVNYNVPNWSDGAVFVLIVLMLIGGGTCSTAGGIKQYRVYVMFKSVMWQIKRALLPRNAVTENYIWEGSQKDFISDSRLKVIGNFVALYLFLFFIGSMIIMTQKSPQTGMYYSMREAMFEFASSIGTVGLSIGVSLPDTPKVVLWTETIGMYLGRLEFFVVFSGIWKIIVDTKRLIRFQ